MFFSEKIYSFIKFNNLSCGAFLVMLVLILFGNPGKSYAQESYSDDPRFITQEDKELEKAKKFKVKTRTAVIYHHGSFAKIAPEGVINEYLKYDSNGNKVEHTRFKGGKSVDTKWKYEYDDKGNIITLQGIDDTGRLQYQRVSTYNKNSSEIERREYKITSKEEYKIIYDYNEFGKLKRSDTYNSKGEKIWSEQLNYEGQNLTEQKSYNQAGENVSMMKFKCNKTGSVTEEIQVDPKTKKSTTINTYKYDKKGNLIEQISSNFKQMFEYNNRGDVVEDIMYNAFGGRQHKFKIEYDEKGLLIKRIRYNSNDKQVYTVKYEYEYY
ncbi:MAG: hypothetical protein A2V66_18010 [Ignavibacteria bacterium RBG_13_36_8]|nr:MAG: hypothetical protein A2V66_18010 [Ignavibacteria bacterium RBG_13_36_8]